MGKLLKISSLPGRAGKNKKKGARQKVIQKVALEIKWRDMKTTAKLGKWWTT